jgi:hypothetical protein
MRIPTIIEKSRMNVAENKKIKFQYLRAMMLKIEHQVIDGLYCLSTLHAIYSIHPSYPKCKKSRWKKDT